MKKFLFLLFIYLWVLGSAFAQEPSKYNLGSAQGAEDLTVSPGDEVIARIYFYNVFGNRTTHIALGVAEAPGNWKIEIIPGLTTETYDVAGVLTDVEENLAVEPDEIVDEVPAEGREGFIFIPAPNIGGFIPAKEVWVIIKVPYDEELGKTFTVKIDAEASWLGQLGTVAFKQGRTFEYNITTVAEEFYERKVGAAPPEKERGITEIILEGVNAFIVFATSPTGVAIVALVIVVAVLLFFKIRKPKKPFG